MREQDRQAIDDAVIDGGGQGRARRPGGECAGVASADRKCRVSRRGRQRVRIANWSGCWRCRIAARGTKPILEINTKHALVKSISDAKLAGRDADVTDLSELLLDQARVLDGEVPSDPAAFAARVNRLVLRGLG